MKNKTLWIILSCIMAVALVLASCTATTDETEEAVQEEAVQEEAVQEEAGTPQYGGKITLGEGTEPTVSDPWDGAVAVTVVDIVLEKLGMADWGLDRDVYDFTSYYVPLAVVKPHLAESYEMPDPLTIIFYIRKGVHWHDKPPMNGREFDAYDVEFTLHRMLGLGSGFTEPSPYATSITSLPIESVTATDKWTVVFKMSSPNFNTLDMVYFESAEGSWIQPREVIEQYGDLTDWRNLVGTGPYELTDWVSGSALTFTRNPGYWGYDERYPENRLPYADEIKWLVIPNEATRLSAMRSGQIVRVTAIAPEQAESLWGTNPKLLFSSAAEYGDAIAFNMTIPDAPWQDIRVRKAMQMVLDLEHISETYYKGNAEATPYGIVGPAVVGYYIPFDEWPEEVKEGFRYDVEKAKQLMVDAGLADGFKTTYELAPAFTGDVDVAQILKTYWAEIGVDVEIKVLDLGAYYGKAQGKGYEGMIAGIRGTNYNPLVYVRTMGYSGEMWNFTGASDPEYDALVDKAEAATELEELMRYIREADMRWIEQHYEISLLRPALFTFWQPWLGGYNGEITLGGSTYSTIFSRIWIDQELK
ncbi:MAG: ABC transporter substrate-binding protein, partial [Candidatus Bathyanammoxibius sp.]